ncbi:hypothetical protein HNY73_006759 [Argiope bruennichi]|uniref:Uncharacterized protein n=1 Tax=Argiope bruennichi TaxID=94029 RepID=A0A8T0FIW4_ARGBR|nr:hypothetical protein HNY73_006759 [Argiope bruennichi]
MDAFADLQQKTIQKPPRPRSADFLERDADCGVMPDVAMYSQSRQPQRPKSSLEYYDRYGDSEDGNFDYYREAVRIQADNLYANKNLNKSRKHHRMKQTENVAYNDPQNIHYTDNNYMFNDQVSPCYASGSKACGSNIYSESSDVSSRYFQNEHHDTRSRHSKPKKNKEESLQRLLEWKQRMLQSPLTKRNHVQSNSSDNSSPMASPQKSYKTEYQKKVRKDLQTRDTYFHSSSKPNDYAYAPASSQEDSPQRIGNQRRRNESSSSLKDNRRDISNPSPKFSNIEHPKFSPQLPDPSINSNLSVSAENLYKQNIMYCVDSENNEILFSYDDSPTGNTPKSFQTCHYPPQMHSFTTMPNVSSIGSDSHDGKKYDASDSQEHSHWKETSSLPRKTPDKVPVNVVSAHHRTTYSSDDEGPRCDETRAAQKEPGSTVCSRRAPDGPSVRQGRASWREPARPPEYRTEGPLPTGPPGPARTSQPPGADGPDHAQRGRRPPALGTTARRPRHLSARSRLRHLAGGSCLVGPRWTSRDPASRRPEPREWAAQPAGVEARRDAAGMRVSSSASVGCAPAQRRPRNRLGTEFKRGLTLYSHRPSVGRRPNQWRVGGRFAARCVGLAAAPLRRYWNDRSQAGTGSQLAPDAPQGAAREKDDGRKRACTEHSTEARACSANSSGPERLMESNVPRLRGAARMGAGRYGRHAERQCTRRRLPQSAA